MQGTLAKNLLDLSEWIHPITVLFRKGAKFEFTPATEVIVREILAELSNIDTF